MSSLRNWVYSPAPKLPAILRGKLEFVANYPMTEIEANEFSIALNAIAMELETDGISTSDLTRVTAVITRNGSFEFEDNGENSALGLHFSLVVYAFDRIRVKREEVGDNPIVFFIVYIEELVHHFWRLEDEVETKVKVAKILSHIYNRKIQVTDLFPREWLNAELERQGKEARY